MEEKIKNEIKNNTQIKKFSAYGFLRNLTFFKPFLLVYFMTKGLVFFEIGILYAIREVVVYILEVPSGIIADYYGRKKEMYLCFIFYILSFALFFIAGDFYVFIIAMLLFGAGEAFRSGTHKAMILSYLEKNDLSPYKVYIYGRTRSFSLIGAAISALISIFISLYSPDLNYIFVFSIVPYILNLFLIYSYPDYLDKEDNKHENKKLNIFLKEDVLGIFRKDKLRSVLLNQSFFEAFIKSLKDLVQPIILGYILATYLYSNNIHMLNEDKIVLGIFYFLLSIISAIATKKSHLLEKYISHRKFIYLSFAFMGMIILAISFSLENIALVAILFILLNVLNNLRKPIYISVLDEYMDKKTRATVISVEYQITAIIILVFAPFFGYIADHTGLFTALFGTGLAILLSSFISIFNNFLD